MISSHDWLWRQMCIKLRFTSVLPSKFQFAVPCTDCHVTPLANNSLTSVTNFTTDSPPSSQASLQYRDVLDYDHFDVQSLSKGHHESYNKMFLNHRRIFHDFRGGQFVIKDKICDHHNRITAIDYHNGYLATGR